MRILIPFITGLLLFFSALAAYFYWMSWAWSFCLGVLLLVGIYDVIQKRHTILRNFPIIGHFRYLLEMFRPEIQQYFVESDSNGKPLSRIYRSVVYGRAKGELQTVPFGSELDLYSSDYR